MSAHVHRGPTATTFSGARGSRIATGVVALGVALLLATFLLGRSAGTLVWLTGEVRILKHVAVDDCGKVLNPLLAEGQVQGGIAQGIAQALFEEVVYDAEGTPRSASLLDYAVPTCNEMPPLVLGTTETPTPLNPLGAKGIGESGTIGSTPAVWNAVIDALSHLGVRHIDMPLAPERVWRAIQEAGRA